MIFDTNAFIAWMKQDENLLRVVESHSQIILTLISIGELFHGVSHSARADKNKQVLETALNDVRILFPDMITATIYGEICSKTQRKGRPIPSNDAWIAALALQHDLSLLTRDNHFSEVESLDIETW